MNLRFEEETKREKRIQILKEIVWFLIAAVLVIFAAWLIVQFAMKKASMIGSAMEPTLYNGEDVIVNKTSFLILSPRRGAVIAFYPEQDENEMEMANDSSILIRRVVGLPGETIQIRDGRIYVDGTVLEEEYLFEPIISAGRANDEIKLDPDEYFVLSDKRADQDDSRNTTFTKVRKGNIIGKVILRLNPFSMVGGPTATGAATEGD